MPTYPVLVVVTILATGNHFVVDVLAGVLAMVAGFALALLPAAYGGRIEGATRGGAAR